MGLWQKAHKELRNELQVSGIAARRSKFIIVELNWLGRGPLGRLSSLEETCYLVYCCLFICIYKTLACQTLAWWDVLKAAGSVALLLVCCLVICFITWADRKRITAQHFHVGLAVFCSASGSDCGDF